MNQTKEKVQKSKSFERKIEQGKQNSKYVDLLEEDKPIARQKFVKPHIILTVW